ncbi:MAG: Hint domain-containing protein [Pseudomonadota bacterium]
MRKYEISYLAANGDGQTLARLAPATPLFEAPFMAFARGTLIATPEGPVAIEDIQPGMVVSTADGDALSVLWKGATTVVPGAAGQHEAAGRFTRITAEAIGLARPSHDLLLGMGARVWRAARGIMAEAQDFIDGEAAFSVIPPSPVRVFHLALKHHARIKANNVEVESFHPGGDARALYRPEIKALYVSLFPHVRSLEDFGPLREPRQGEADAESQPLMLY